MEALGGKLDILNIGLYEADGVTPVLMRGEDIDFVLSSGGTLVNVFDLKYSAWSPGASFDWIAPRAGGLFLTVSGVHGSVGAFADTITTTER